MSKQKHWDKYWPCVMIQNASDERAWCCGSYDCYCTLEEALKVIEKHKEHNVVLCAWVQKQRKNVFKCPVWFESYTNTLGQVNGRFVMKEDRR